MSITPEALQYALGIHPSQALGSDEDEEQQRQIQQNGFAGNALGMPSAAPNSEATPRHDNGAPAGVTANGAATKGQPTLGVGPVETPGKAASGSGTSAAPATPPSPKPSSYNPLTDPIRKQIGEDQVREAADRAEAERLKTTGSGVSQFQHRHHILGPIIRGLDIAGAVLAPGVSQMVPGTELHHRQLEGEANARVNKDVEDQTKHFNMFDRIEANRVKDEATATREAQMGAKFVAGSEHEDPNSPTGYTAQTVAGDWKPYTPPASYKQTKGESFEEVQRKRESEAERMGLKGEERRIYIANGKLPEPGTHIHVPSAEAEHYHDTREAFKEQFGRYPKSPDDFDTFNRMLKGEHAGGAKDYTSQRVAVERKKEDELARLEQEFRRDWAKAEDDDQRNQLTAALNDNKARVQKAYEAELAQIPTGEQHPPEKVSGQSKGTPATRALAPGTDVGGGFKYAQQVTVDGKPAYITGYNPQTKKPKVSFTQPK